MKKILCMLLTVTMMLSVVACGSKEASAKPGDTMTLQEIVDAVLKDVDNLPEVMSVELDENSFPYVAFVEKQEGMEGIASDALINATAHSVVVVRTTDAATAETVAKEMDVNKNPAKWVCVEAEKSQVVVHGSTILLVMSSAATADAIIANFDALWA